MMPPRAVRAEWTKLRTLPSTACLVLLAVLGTAGVALAVTGSLDSRHCEPACALDVTEISLAGVRLGQVGIVILAVLAVTAEYSTRTIHPTLTAVPSRVRVVLAKLTVVTALTTVAGALAVTGSLAAGRALLPGNGFPALSLADHLTRRAAAGTVLYLGLVGLLAAGLGLLLRDTAAAVTAALALLYGAPVVAMFLHDPVWQVRVHRLSPMDAGLAIQATRDFAAAPIGAWAGLGVLSLYAAAAVAAGLIVFQRRDAG
ncbi:ABC transporter permease [Actinoplanes sp. NBC_00393]|uniref:ABC transporter permease n=1 Tax=Actinoplanes sp. NBC_00393 TaxID=2975953 RepID=UPI002E2295E5